MHELDGPEAYSLVQTAQGASVCSTFDPEMKVATQNRALGEVN